jgi:hypothetical protein
VFVQISGKIPGVAGKTTRGVGDKEAEEQLRLSREAAPLIADEDDARGLHSGPTVVDDAKVAEVLKKLRSLDRPTGKVAEVVLDDANATAPARLDPSAIKVDPPQAIKLDPPSGIKADPGAASLQDLMYPLQRPTAIGRSLATPVVGQPVTIPADAARGTLFGRSIHLPDVNAPDEVPVELSSGSVEIDGAPTPSQPFPLADRPAIALPPPVGAPAGPLASTSAFVDPSRRFHTPYDPEAHTQVVPTRSRWKPAFAVAGGLLLAGAGWYGWTQLRGEDAPSPLAPPPRAATPPAIQPLPSPGGATAPAPAEPAVAAPADEPNPATKESAKTEPAKTEPALTEPAKAEPAKAEPAKAEATTKAPAAPPSAPAPTPERRAPARVSAPADEPRPPPSRHSRSRRRATAAPTPEDPDDTLPPSL